MEFNADELSDFTKLKRLREAGYFESKGSVPMPEIVADGEKPDDEYLRLLDECATRKGQSHEVDFKQIESRLRRDWPVIIFCDHCQQETEHGQVATYNTGNPVFHCNSCCECHLCMERSPSRAYQDAHRPMSLQGMQRLYEEVTGTKTGRIAPPETPTFCEDCGAMLRCTVCMGDGPGHYCQTCGQKEDHTGRCPDCWKGD